MPWTKRPPARSANRRRESGPTTAIGQTSRPNRSLLTTYSSRLVPSISAHRRNFEPIANLCAGAIDSVRRKLQHAGCLERHFGDAKGANVLFDVHDLFIFAEKDEVDWEEHADGMHAARWHNP